MNRLFSVPHIRHFFAFTKELTRHKAVSGSALIITCLAAFGIAMAGAPQVAYCQAGAPCNSGSTNYYANNSSPQSSEHILGDTYITSLTPDTNYGTEQTVLLRSDPANGDQIDGLLLLDTSSIPTNAVAIQLVVPLSNTASISPNADVTVTLTTNASGPFSETAATWGTRPSQESTTEERNLPGASFLNGQKVDAVFTVTDAIKYGSASLGFTLATRSTDYFGNYAAVSLAFDSKENTNASARYPYFIYVIGSEITPVFDPQPTPTPSPSTSPTTSPTASPESSPSPESVPSPESSLFPESSPTPSPLPSTSPTAAPIPTPTPTPVPTQAPSTAPTVSPGTPPGPGDPPGF